MRVQNILPLVAVSSAFVLPSEQALKEVAVENNHRATGWYNDFVSKSEHIISESKDAVNDFYEEVKEKSKDAWDQVSEYTSNGLDEAIDKADNVYDAASATGAWLESEANDVYDAVNDGHHRPHHPPHDKKPNMTVFQLIAGSKYTTKLAELISEFDDLVEALNSTDGNFTVFAPTDKALGKIPEDAPKPSKEQLKKFLSYHVVPDFYPAARVLASHTFPTLLKSDSLGQEPLPQRLARRIGLRGLTINFFSRVIAINIFGTNGVIHGIDTPLIPPPSAIQIIDLFPGAYSTLELGLGKTGLLDMLNTTDHAGGTLFAPNNDAFQKLGPKVNAFLFSRYGLKYLKALLEYHVVPDNTLYSDAYYKASSEIESLDVPKGYYHIDLPTLLEDRSLAIDIGRYGGLIDIKVNAFARVAVQDVVAEDGVIQVMNDVIIPPKKIGDKEVHWEGGELSVEELKERLERFVPKNDL